jgi:xanthine dehydrogenase large subunit
VKNIDSKGHAAGKTVYLDDIPELKGTLYGVVFGSAIAHGRIIRADYSGAAAFPGVEGVFTYKDIPGKNQIGGIIEDETLFAEKEVHYKGQPVALIVARSELVARKASRLISIEFEEFEAITDPRIAKDNGLLLVPPRTFRMGNISDSWSKCDYVFTGRSDLGGQEHLYLETQGSYVWPAENNCFKIHSSTQGPTLVQKTVARVLGISMNKVEVDVARLGGGFGGKEDQATGFACMAALAAKKLKKPVKICLLRQEDIIMTGKRHPYSADFKIGLSKDHKIIAYEAVLYQNAGAASDLSPAILERTLFHSTNCYYIPNTEVTVYSCRTNLPPNTAFRGFGAPQGMFIIESAIAEAASRLGVTAKSIQEKNFLNENDEFQYGQRAENVNIRHCFNTANDIYKVEKLEKEIIEFNSHNYQIKKGIAVMPVCFGISFTTTQMNQARALVHIYQDGSIGISTGAVEMGQGVNTKMVQVAAKVFSISPDKIKLESTNTSRVANTSPTSASSGADLNGKALQQACNELLARLRSTASRILGCDAGDIDLHEQIVYQNGIKTDLTWDRLIGKAYSDRISLTGHGHYATPQIYFDKTREKGHPFAYHVYGLAVVVATVDCIRGIYEFDKVLVVHDFGETMNQVIDLGQVEGGIVQGIGWVTMEELSFSQSGNLLSDSLSTYKIPDIYSVPKELICNPLKTDGPESAIFKSKAVGEPPFMYGIGAYFAVQNAIRAFNPNHRIDFNIPLTPEKVLMRLYEKQ